jgi:hypothetical protein
MDVVLKLRRKALFELTVLADRDIPDVSSEGGVLRVVSHGSGTSTKSWWRKPMSAIWSSLGIFLWESASWNKVFR